MSPDPIRAFSPELLGLLRRHLPSDRALATLGTGKPNWIMEIGRDGILVETEKSRAAARPAQPVPAWMFQVAWDRLNARGRLTNRELVSLTDLNVKRSSLVCAALAEFPMVTVVSRRPITLLLDR